MRLGAAFMFLVPILFLIMKGQIPNLCALFYHQKSWAFTILPTVVTIVCLFLKKMPALNFKCLKLQIYKHAFFFNFFIILCSPLTIATYKFSPTGRIMIS